MSEPSTVTILGAGYVGLTTAALLAHAGFKVYALEPNIERLKAIKQGRSFFYEEGLDPVIATAIKNGTLVPTDSYKESIPKSSMVFSCVGTPDNPDGSTNLAYVFAAAEEAASYAADGTIFVQKSTVPVGTGQKIEELFKKLGKKIHYVSNPEFLREGTALYDTLCFDRVVAGGRDTVIVEQVLDIYRQLERYRDTIAKLAGITLAPEHGRYIATNLNSAELIKVTSNAFLALKISFANSIAKLADQTDADVVDVMDAVGADARIGRAFLNAGRGYGGGCFPKDVSGLIASGLQHGVDLDVMTAAQNVNDSMPGYVVEKIKDACDGSLAGTKIAVLGLAFKAGTSDSRRSPGVIIANLLSKEGAVVAAYDPQALDEARGDLRDDITVARSMTAVIKNADVIIIATAWPELIEHGADKYKAAMRGTLLVDAVNGFDISEVIASGLRYIGVGRKML